MARRMILVRFWVLACGAAAGGCAGTTRLAQVLQVKCEPSLDVMRYGEFTSPSKAFRLEVVPENKPLYPSDTPLPGFTGAAYRMFHEGKEVWNGNRAYTLRQPVLTDDGTVVGVAYNYQREGDNPSAILRDYLRIVIIRDGQDVLDWAVERIAPSFESNPPAEDRPYAEILTVDPANDRIIVRVLEHDKKLFGRRACWLFRLSNGEFLSRIDLVQLLTTLGHVNRAKCSSSFGVSVYVTEMRVVAGTSLMLFHFRLPGTPQANEGESTRYDSLYTLVDGSGTPVWTLRVPNNSTSRNDQREADGPEWDPSHAVLVTGKPGCFGVFRTWEDCVETYAVQERRPAGWKVTMTGRMTLGQARREHGVESQPAVR